MFASFLSWLGNLAASMGTSACTILFTDEPKMPKSLLNKQLIKTQSYVTEFFYCYFLFLIFVHKDY